MRVAIIFRYFICNYANKTERFGFILLPASSYMNPQRPEILKGEKNKEKCISL